MEQSSNKLNRFTTLPFLIDLLLTEQLTFLSYKKWRDQTDVELLSHYEKQKKVKLFILCFTNESETIHHWNSYANGESGCCIEFNNAELIEYFNTKKIDIEHTQVSYPPISKISPSDINKLPFIKRYPYKCETEYRFIIKKSKSYTKEEVKIKFPLNLIKKINLSPDLPHNIFISVKQLLQLIIAEKAAIEISNSTMFKNNIFITKTIYGT